MPRMLFAPFAALALTGCYAAQEDAPPPAQAEIVEGDKAVSILNAGVRAEMGGAKFLFDPLYDDHFGTFEVMGDALIEKIVKGDAPYDGVDAVLVSHAHGDHFSASNLNRLMATQKGVKLVAPKQAVDAMRENAQWQDRFEPRIVAIELENGESAESFEVEGTLIEAFRSPHSGWPERHFDTHNITYRLSSTEGVRVMHLGDADPGTEHFEAHRALLESSRTALALVPFWYFGTRDPEALIDETLNADSAVAMHVPVETPRVLQSGKWDYFSEEGQERALKSSE